MLPELQAAREWQVFGLRELLNEMDKQVLAERTKIETRHRGRNTNEMVRHSVQKRVDEWISLPRNRAFTSVLIEKSPWCCCILVVPQPPDYLAGVNPVMRLRA